MTFSQVLRSMGMQVTLRICLNRPCSKVEVIQARTCLGIQSSLVARVMDSKMVVLGAIICLGIQSSRVDRAAYSVGRTVVVGIACSKGLLSILEVEG